MSSEGAQTTFSSPVVESQNEPKIKRTVTLYASGSTTVNTALEPCTLTLEADDIKEAIGVGADQYVPALK